MAGLAVQNFVSAAVGLAVAVALIRGLAARRSGDARALGNFWQDLIRGDALRPAADRVHRARCCSSRRASCRRSAATAHGVARGPGRLAGGDQGARHQRRRLLQRQLRVCRSRTRPGSRTSLEMFLILCIPASLTSTYGRMVGNRRQGWAIFCAMSLLFLVSVVVVFVAERHGTPAQHAAGRRTARNLEGKEHALRHRRPPRCSTAVTTVTSCGAVNAAFESLTGIGGLVPMVEHRRTASPSSAASAPACTRCCSTSCWPSSSAG